MHFPFQNKAKELNDQLYADVRSVTPGEKRLIEEEIVKQCKILGYDKQYTTNWLTHNYRIALTLREIDRIIKEYHVKTILDLGEESLVADLVRRLFPHVHVTSTKGDLRKTFGVRGKKFDMILSTEVFEHISDLPSTYNDHFAMSGLRTSFALCRRHLRPSGILFFTTPNACSVRVIEKALNEDMPMMYDPHVREYTLPILRAELQRAKFAVVDAHSVHCITVGYNTDYSSLFQYLLDHKLDTSNRGDDVFIIAQRS